jgi:hypothetical protein
MSWMILMTWVIWMRIQMKAAFDVEEWFPQDGSNDQD